MRETTKIIVIEDQGWELRKVTALQGSNILRKYLASGKVEPQEFLGTLSDEEYGSLQKTCLCAVSMVKDTEKGPAKLPVMVIDGRWGIDEPTSALTYGLVMASLMFQLQDFFDASALKGFDLVMQCLKPSNA